MPLDEMEMERMMKMMKKKMMKKKMMKKKMMIVLVEKKEKKQQQLRLLLWRCVWLHGCCWIGCGGIREGCVERCSRCQIQILGSV